MLCGFVVFGALPVGVGAEEAGAEDVVAVLGELFFRVAGLDHCRTAEACCSNFRRSRRNFRIPKSYSIRLGAALAGRRQS